MAFSTTDDTVADIRAPLPDGSPTHVVWLGTYESNYPRTRVLVSGLRALGVEVEECHRPLWELTRHKAGSFLSPRNLPATLARYVRAWAALAREQRALRGMDAIVAGYPAQLDAPLAWCFARRHRVPLVVDAMISLADTLTEERDVAGPMAARVLKGIDGTAVRLADRVIVDTAEHGRWFTETFGLDPARVAVVPIGGEEELFPPAPPPGGPPHALFWGKPAPLHGLETVLRATSHPGAPPLRLIGDGQLGDWLRAQLAREQSGRIEHIPWVPHEQLAREIASAAICLGIFGTTAKTGRVIPNKVYEAMAVGRPIVTADTPAIREMLTHGHDAWLVPAGDADALGEALALLAADEELRARLGAEARRTFERAGSPAAVAERFLEAMRRPS